MLTNDKMDDYENKKILLFWMKYDLWTISQIET